MAVPGKTVEGVGFLDPVRSSRVDQNQPELLTGLDFEFPFQMFHAASFYPNLVPRPNRARRAPAMDVLHLGLIPADIDGQHSCGSPAAFLSVMQ